MSQVALWLVAPGVARRGGTTARAEPSLLAGKCHKPLEMALIATYPQEAVLEATAFEIRFKLPMDMSRQTFALKFQLLNYSGVVFLYQLVEQSLLWAMQVAAFEITLKEEKKRLVVPDITGG